MDHADRGWNSKCQHKNALGTNKVIRAEPEN